MRRLQKNQLLEQKEQKAIRLWRRAENRAQKILQMVQKAYYSQRGKEIKDRVFTPYLLGD